jgi:hypothetical protein
MNGEVSLRPQTAGFGRPESKVETYDAEDQTPEEIHPLSLTWAMMWDDGVASKRGTNVSFKTILEFNTVESFWNLYNNLSSPIDLPGKSNKYYVFKQVPFSFCFIIIPVYHRASFLATKISTTSVVAIG